jgi:hypothetical protein
VSIAKAQSTVSPLLTLFRVMSAVHQYSSNKLAN